MGVGAMRKLRFGFVSLAVALGALSWGASANAQSIQYEIFDNGVLIGTSPVFGGGAASFTFSNPDAFFTSVQIQSQGVGVLPNPDFGTQAINATANFGGAPHTLTVLATQFGLTGFPSGVFSSSFAANYL